MAKQGTKLVKVSAAAWRKLMKEKGKRIAKGVPCSLADIVDDWSLVVAGEIPRRKV